MPSIIDISEVLLEMGLADVSETDYERAVVNSAITRAEGAIKRFLRYDPVQRTRTEFYPQKDLPALYQRAVWESQGDKAILRGLAGAATDLLQVQHIPIRSITSLVIDYSGRFGTSVDAFTATAEIEGSDYWPTYDGVDDDGNSFCRDGLIRSFGRWPTEPGSVKVVYSAGYTKAELHGQANILDASPIIDAVINESKRRALKVFIDAKSTTAGGTGFVAGPIVSERMGDYSYQIGGGGGSGSSTDRKLGGIYDLLPETISMLSDFVNWGWSLSGG